MPSPPRHSVALVGRAALRRRADGGDRGGVHDPLDVRAQALLQHRPRRHRRWPAKSASADAAQVGRAGDVEDARDALAARAAPRAGRSGRRRRSRRRGPPARRGSRSPRTVTRTSSPRATSARATCEPTNPVAPVTRVVGMGPRGYKPLRSPPMARVAVVTDTTHYLPRDAGRRGSICTWSRSTSPSRARPSARPTSPTSTTSTRGSAPRSEMPSTSQPSVGDFLAVYEPLLEAGRRHRLDPPRAAASPAPFAAAEQARDQLVERGIAPSGSSCSTPPPPAPGSG